MPGHWAIRRRADPEWGTREGRASMARMPVMHPPLPGAPGEAHGPCHFPPTCSRLFPNSELSPRY
eukprot:4503990-Pyramimonas_sp.AAC.1